MSDPENPAFTPTELERYARHIILAEIGGPGQQKLKRARVLVVGAGGLGAPVLQYLAAAGVGTLGIVDDDRVSLSNLQRQVIHDTDLVGSPKVESAIRAIAAINPHVTVEAHETRIAPDNAADLISRYHIVVDGSDQVIQAGWSHIIDFILRWFVHGLLQLRRQGGFFLHELSENPLREATIDEVKAAKLRGCGGAGPA